MGLVTGLAWAILFALLVWVFHRARSSPTTEMCPFTPPMTTRFGSVNGTWITKTGIPFYDSVRGTLFCEAPFTTSVYHRMMVDLPVRECLTGGPKQGIAVAGAIAKYCAGDDWLRRFEGDFFTGIGGHPVVVREADIPNSVSRFGGELVVGDDLSLGSVRSVPAVREDMWVALRDPETQRRNMVVFERLGYHFLWPRASSHPHPGWTAEQMRLGLDTATSRVRDGFTVVTAKAGYGRLDNLRIVVVVPSRARYQDNIDTIV